MAADEGLKEAASGASPPVFRCDFVVETGRLVPSRSKIRALDFCVPRGPILAPGQYPLFWCFRRSRLRLVFYASEAAEVLGASA